MKMVDGNVFNSNATFIMHQVNCKGVMGSGVAKQVKEKYPNVFYAYKRRCDAFSPKVLLGTAQLVETNKDYNTEFVGIFNLFSQDAFGYDGKKYTDYSALRRCLFIVNETCKELNTIEKPTVAMPFLMGCDRGGGDWDTVCKIIDETLTDCQVLCYKFGKNSGDINGNK